MELTRKQFDIQEALVMTKGALTQRSLEQVTGHSLGAINRVMKELVELGYVVDREITRTGINALEPYRVKRAIFIAAEFNARLAPITFDVPKPLVRVHGVRIIDQLIDACLEAGVNEIYIVRGYLGELFDQLLYKYPMIKFLENPMYSETNNISSLLIARHILANAYVFEADLLINNPKIIRRYHYTSNFLAVKKERCDARCFCVKDGIITEEKVGGEGEDIWQVVGTNYIPYQRKSVRRNDVEAIKTISLPKMVGSRRTEEGIQRAISEGIGKRPPKKRHLLLFELSALCGVIMDANTS